jgi:hypothetical protein
MTRLIKSRNPCKLGGGRGSDKLTRIFAFRDYIIARSETASTFLINSLMRGRA